MSRQPRRPARLARSAARWALGAFLVAAGIAHFVVADEFLAQVPPSTPWPRQVVAVSGVLEILLGVATITADRRRGLVGRLVAVFLLAIWPGNIAQAATGTDGFGLTSDTARWTRVAAQPLLIAWALWATGPHRRSPQRQLDT